MVAGMTYELDPTTGLFFGAAQYTIRQRLGEDGQSFTPVNRGLHPEILKLYGTVAAATVHCTDVVCPGASLARRTAETSPRKSSYNLLVDLDGALHQLAPVQDRTWHAGRGPRSAAYEEEARRAGGVCSGPAGDLYRAGRGWLWPIVHGRVVGDPNNWGPGIELMGKPGRPTGAQLVTLGEVLAQLYEKTAVTPATVWRHGDLDPLHRTDPGWDVAEFARVVHPSAHDGRERDGWEAGEPDPDPASGMGQHP